MVESGVRANAVVRCASAEIELPNSGISKRSTPHMDNDNVVLLATPAQFSDPLTDLLCRRAHGATGVSVCSSPVDPTPITRSTENLTSSSALAVQPPRLSPYRLHSPGVRNGKLSLDPSFQPFATVDSQEPEQLAEYQSNARLQD